MTHSLDLESVYGSMNGGVEPNFTNYTDGFVGVLDYIWFSHNLRTVSVAQIPPVHVLREMGDKALPNYQYPSDHVSLAATLELVTQDARGSRGHHHHGGHSHQNQFGGHGNGGGGWA